MRCLKLTECHMYFDGQQYFIEAVLDISQKATAVEGRGDNGVLSQRWAKATPL